MINTVFADGKADVSLIAQLKERSGEVDKKVTLAVTDIIENVKKYARNGSIIVFHDSLKAQRNLKEALPKTIEWLLKEGYQIKRLPFNFIMDK